MVASDAAPLTITFTLSPAFNSTFGAGLISGVGVAGAGVAAGTVFVGFTAFESSVGLDSQAVMANDNSAIARIFFIMSSVCFGSLGREFLCSPVNGERGQNVSGVMKTFP